MRKRLVRYEEQFWRTGQKVGRTVYAVMGLVPSDHDPLIGVMDSKALAEAAIQGHNALLLRQAAERKKQEEH